MLFAQLKCQRFNKSNLIEYNHPPECSSLADACPTNDKIYLFLESKWQGNIGRDGACLSRKCSLLN